MNYKNRRGQWSTPMKIILVVLVLLVSSIIYGRIMAGSTRILQCNKNGGDCVTGTCDWLTQVPALSDKAAGCKKSELCCINITFEETEDPYCKDLNVGDRCRIEEANLYYCGFGKTCVSKCEYCAKFWGEKTLNSICGEANIKKFEQNNNPKISQQWGCSCGGDICTDEMQRQGKCILNFCPSTDPETYCCLIEPSTAPSTTK
jgi:hypothetical protein